MSFFKKVLIFNLMLSLVCVQGLMAEEKLPLLPQGPLLLTSVKPEQLTADYWISRLPDPDHLLKTPQEIALFNKEILSMAPDRADIFDRSRLPSGTEIRSVLNQEYATVSNRKFFGVDDRVIPKSFFESSVKPVMNLDRVPDRLNLKWAVATKATSVRALPTDTAMLEDVGDWEFDQLQYTLIKLWTPVVIYHRSSDGGWYYIQAPYVRGWVRAKDIAIYDSMEALKKKLNSDPFLVVTGEHISVYSDSAHTSEWYQPTMGTILPLVRTETDHYIVSRPLRGEGGNIVFQEGYVGRSADVSEGFLAYTQRNVIKQAFKLLGVRYGWGGMFGGRDCSGFTHDVFLPFGIAMPRDSKNQVLIGTQLGHWEAFQSAEEKLQALRAATPGVTLLRKPLHIMLYLGEVDGQFYIMHSTWAERISKTSDEKNRINQVVVSDLTLNGNSYLGALFDRTESMNELL